MGELIGFLVIILLFCIIPYSIDKNNSETRRKNTENYLKNKQMEETEKWRR